MKISLKIYFLFILVLLVFQAYNQENVKVFPYHLNTKTEIVTISSGIALNLSYSGLKNSGYVDLLSEDELNDLDSKQINSFDQKATEYWSPKYSDYSDYIKNTLRYVPAAFAIPYIKSKSWKNIFTLGFIYIEGYLVTTGLTRCTKILVQRERPYMYNTTTIPEIEKLNLSQEENSYFSFFSGHTSSSFYSATFISKAYYDIYGANEWFYIISTLSYSAASTVAYLRVKSGKHYPSDVIVGAIVGTGIGYLIPQIHKRKNKNLTVYFPANNQIGLIYQF